MDARKVTRALKEIQKKLELDFVLNNFGTCCRTCAMFRTQAQDEAYNKAKTYLIGIHFVSGMNFKKAFKDYKKDEPLHLAWGFDINYLDIVKSIFEKHGFTCEIPLSDIKTIKIWDN